MDGENWKRGVSEVGKREMRGKVKLSLFTTLIGKVRRAPPGWPVSTTNRSAHGYQRLRLKHWSFDFAV